MLVNWRGLLTGFAFAAGRGADQRARARASRPAAECRGCAGGTAEGANHELFPASGHRHQTGPDVAARPIGCVAGGGDRHGLRGGGDGFGSLAFHRFHPDSDRRRTGRPHHRDQSGRAVGERQQHQPRRGRRQSPMRRAWPRAPDGRPMVSADMLGSVDVEQKGGWLQFVRHGARRGTGILRPSSRNPHDPRPQIPTGHLRSDRWRWSASGIHRVGGGKPGRPAARTLGRDRQFQEQRWCGRVPAANGCTYPDVRYARQPTSRA